MQLLAEVEVFGADHPVDIVALDEAVLDPVEADPRVGKGAR